MIREQKQGKEVENPFKMNDKICYYESETASKLHETVTQSVIYKKSRNFPRILFWSKYTGEIPSTQHFADGFKKYYLSKVVDHNALEDLEDEKVINAVPNLAKLYPIITPADGNCLCHAVSLYLWGIPDRGNFLRQLLYITLVTDENKLLQRLYMQHVANQQFSEENFNTCIWNNQWDRLVKEAQEIPVNPGSTHLEPLEAIHIFILANILLRPIIVLSSPVVRTVFNHTIQTNNIGGIYLPLLCNPDDTEKSPIVLGFHMNHFTPLIHMENNTQIKAIPLKRIELVTLPVHFFQDLLPNNITKKLKTYLNIDKETESALIRQVPLPKHQNMFYAHFEHCKVLYDNAAQSVAGKATFLKGTGQISEDEWNHEFLERHSETIHIISSSLKKSPSPCINNCGMYGSAELGNKCSKCFAMDSSLSDMNPQKRAEQKQELRATYEDVLGQNTNEKSLQCNIEQLAPARGYQFSPQMYKPSLFQSSQKKSQEISVRNHKQEQSQFFLLSHHDFQPAEFLKEAQNESTLFIPMPKQVDQQFEQMNLETATCITSGCQGKAHRKLQYRCASCFIKRNEPSTGGAFFRSVHKENDLRTVDNFSQLSENLPEILPGQAAVANSSDLNPVDRTNILTQMPLLNTENNQVSLLELLCSKDNCPNRRISPFHSLCFSCSQKNGNFYCSNPGCTNEREQNSHAMCKDCFRNNELKRPKIPTKRNTTNHIPDSESNNTNHERKKCDKPNCINSRGTHCSGYCIKCYISMEKPEHALPSAPSFHN